MKKLVVTTMVGLFAMSSTAFAGSSCCSFNKTDSKKSDSVKSVEDKSAESLTQGTAKKADKMASTKAE